MEIAKLIEIYTNCNRTIITDTRKITPYCLFFCLVGENFDGNDFAIKAIELGAKAVITSKKENANSNSIFYVPDTLITLQQLATAVRLSYNKPVIAIGGSNGKTTTKELCATVLKTAFSTYQTPGNFNNHIGLPLSILETPLNSDLAIYEMGTNHSGEMEVLTNIGLPTIALITNIGKEHLAGFNSFEDIVKEESELFKYIISNNGLGIVNADDPWLSNMSKRISNKLTFGIENNADVKGILHKTMPFASYSVIYKNETFGPFSLQMGGSFNVLNALSAICIGVSQGISIENAAIACQNYIPTNNRSQWILNTNNHVLLDAYNANPSSVELAIKEFALIEGEKLVILGDMFELGIETEKEHTYIKNLAKSLQLNVLYAGEAYYSIQDIDTNAKSFPNLQELKSYLSKIDVPFYILIKGSRGMKLETLLPNFNN